MSIELIGQLTIVVYRVVVSVSGEEVGDNSAQIRTVLDDNSASLPLPVNQVAISKTFKLVCEC